MQYFFDVVRKKLKQAISIYNGVDKKKIKSLRKEWGFFLSGHMS